MQQQAGELAGTLWPLLGSLWGSMPWYTQLLLVLFAGVRTAETAASSALRKRTGGRLASDSLMSPYGPDAAAFDPSRALAESKGPIEVGVTEMGGHARLIRWDGKSYYLDGLKEAIPLPVLAQLLDRHPGKLYATADARQPGVLVQLPPGVSCMLPDCEADGGTMRLWPSHEAEGVWLARCVKDGDHSRPLTREEEGVLSCLTGMRLRAGILYTPDGPRDILWDGRSYTIPGVSGTLPPDRIGELASRPQAKLFGPHAEAALALEPTPS